MAPNPTLAYVEMRPALIFFLVVGVLIIFGLISFLRVAVSRGWGWLSLGLAITFIFAVSSQEEMSSRLSLGLGIVAVIGGIVTVLLPARISPPENAENRLSPVHRILTIVFLALVGFFFARGMFDQVPVYVDGDPITVEFSADTPVVVRTVTVRGADLPDAATCADLYVGGALSVEEAHDPQALESCDDCLAIYTVTFAAPSETNPGQDHYVPRARIEVPRLDWRGVEEATYIESQPTDVATAAITFQADTPVELAPGQQMELVRISVFIPGAAVTSERLDASPAFIKLRLRSDAGTDLGAAGLDPVHCSVGVDCHLASNLVVERTTDLNRTETQIVTLVGDILYTGPPLPPPDVAVLAELDTRATWHVATVSGEATLATAEEAPDGVIYEFDFQLDGIRTGDVVMATLVSPEPRAHAAGSRKATCRDGRCTINFYDSGNHSGETVAWRLDLDIALIDGIDRSVSVQDANLSTSFEYEEDY